MSFDSHPLKPFPEALHYINTNCNDCNQTSPLHIVQHHYLLVQLLSLAQSVALPHSNLVEGLTPPSLTNTNVAF